MKFLKNCFLLGVGASVCYTGFVCSNAAIDKVLNTLANKLEKVAAKMEKENAKKEKQAKWRRMSEERNQR